MDLHPGPADTLVPGPAKTARISGSDPVELGDSAHHLTAAHGLRSTPVSGLTELGRVKGSAWEVLMMRTLIALLLAAVLMLGGCSYGDDGGNTGGGYGAAGATSAAIL